MNTIVDGDHAGTSSHGDAAYAICGIWKNVLNKEEIGSNDDFFDVGGNSMLLIAILEAIREKFGMVIHTDSLAEGVTVERMARLVNRVDQAN